MRQDRRPRSRICSNPQLSGCASLLTAKRESGADVPQLTNCRVKLEPVDLTQLKHPPHAGVSADDRQPRPTTAHLAQRSAELAQNLGAHDACAEKIDHNSREPLASDASTRRCNSPIVPEATMRPSSANTGPDLRVW